MKFQENEIAFQDNEIEMRLTQLLLRNIRYIIDNIRTYVIYVMFLCYLLVYIYIFNGTNNKCHLRVFA